jgi:hypothetical protein
MKNYKILAAVAALTMAMNANAINTINLGDDIRISPRYLDGYYRAQCRAEFDGLCDSWTINVTYPQGLTPKLVAGVTPMDGMGIRYMRADGTEITEVPLIECAVQYLTISATSTYMGYWDYNEDGVLECYGTAKWEPGRHDWFTLNLYVAPYFEEGYITFDGIITSGPDQRGAVLQGVRFYKRTHFWVGYRPGDVTGNERLTIDDVTDLIDLLIGVGYHDEWQRKAADFDGNGEVDIADVTKLLDNIER